MNGILYLCHNKKRHVMMKRLLIIPFVISAVLFSMPSATYADTAIEIIDNEFQNVNITVNASTIHVTGANGMTLYIYNVTGVRVMSIKIDGADRYYELNIPKGCYIAKVGKTVKKISIK